MSTTHFRLLIMKYCKNNTVVMLRSFSSLVAIAQFNAVLWAHIYKLSNYAPLADDICERN